MDEAERCHRIVYIAYGKVVARGTVPEVIAQSGLHTIVVKGGDGALMRRLKTQDGIDEVAPFGTDLHVVGADPLRLGQAVATAIAGTGAVAEPAETSLEDVFIRLMGASADNFGGNGSARP
jgi:ABC-2 type transport system ATP-binding protein